MTTVRSGKEEELLTLIRTQSQILFKTGVSTSEQQASGMPYEQLLILRSSSDFAPSDELGVES